MLFSLPIEHDKYPNRFKKGQSGNLAGRPQMNKEARRASKFARTKTEEAVNALYEVIFSSKASQATKERAASSLVAIGWGRRRTVPEFEYLKMTPGEYIVRLQMQTAGFSNASIDNYIALQQSQLIQTDNQKQKRPAQLSCILPIASMSIEDEQRLIKEISNKD